MSNEYKDYMDDLRVDFDEKMDELYDLPDGWVNSFVPKLKEELFDLLGSYADDFEVLCIKEKYGRMVIYWRWADREYSNSEVVDLNNLYDKVADVINYYTDLSFVTCVVCGKKAFHRSRGWVLPYCTEHFEND